MADKRHSHSDLIEKLESDSRKVAIKINVNQFKTMLKRSNLKSNETAGYIESRRKEQAAAIVLDIVKAEIRLQMMNDKKNTYTSAQIKKNIALVYRTHCVWIDDNEDSHLEQIVIGMIHTHPYNGPKDPLFKNSRYSLDPRKPLSGDFDPKVSGEIGGANYQLGKFNIAKDAMKTFGQDFNRNLKQNSPQKRALERILIKINERN